MVMALLWRGLEKERTNYGSGSPSMDEDGFGGWRLCSVAASVSNDLAPFTEVVAFDLKKTLAVHTSGLYGRDLLVRVVVKLYGTAFWVVVDFVMFVMI